ncbi:MAG: hypothetical protein WC414_03655 [Patescibacteria group bacterium]
MGTEMGVKEYQQYCKDKLLSLYDSVDVEWNPFKKFNVGNKQYCPRLDIAVGPFAINTRLESQYNRLLSERESRKFIDSLIKFNNDNVRNIVTGSETNFEMMKYFNYNARCFICVEIENKVSRKHIVGGLINASALGRIAVLVAWTPDKLKAFLKLKNYLNFLSSVEKNSFKTDNVLILSKEQFKIVVDAINIG